MPFGSTAHVQKVMNELTCSYEQAVKFIWYQREGHADDRARKLAGI